MIGYDIKIIIIIGITLIALVITIIVLLILAGVSVTMLTGNNGILSQAKFAKENTIVAKDDEESKLSNNNDYINGQIGNAVPGKIVTKIKKDNYVDSNGDKATIPTGFSVDETEKTIANGLVVHGPDKTNGDNGSEFVWVPVPDINNMSQCSTAGGNCNLQLENGTLKCKTHNNDEIVGKLYATILGENFGTVNTTYNGSITFIEPAVVTGKNDNTGTSHDDDMSYNNLFSLQSLKNDYKNMANSVAKYGGFYVGRYETSLSSATKDSAGTSGTAQSKKDVIPTTASNTATQYWYGLYRLQSKTYKNLDDTIESSMIWGSQYDRMLNWVKDSPNEIEKAKLTNTSLGNNSSGSVKTTGNEKYSNDTINNIRDLGGNLREWTLEATDSNYRIYRGGFYDYNNSPSCRWKYSERLSTSIAVAV